MSQAKLAFMLHTLFLKLIFDIVNFIAVVSGKKKNSLTELWFYTYTPWSPSYVFFAPTHVARPGNRIFRGLTESNPYVSAASVIWKKGMTV